MAKSRGALAIALQDCWLCSVDASCVLALALEYDYTHDDQLVVSPFFLECGIYGLTRDQNVCSRTGYVIQAVKLAGGTHRVACDPTRRLDLSAFPTPSPATRRHHPELGKKLRYSNYGNDLTI